MPTSRLRDKVVRARLRDLTRAVPGVARARAEAVHAARTATRRLRELVPLLGLPASSARRLASACRRACDGLGRIRDADTQLHLVDALAQLRGLQGPAMRTLRALLADAAVRERRRTSGPRRARDLDWLAGRLRTALGAGTGSDATARLLAHARVVHRAGAVMVALEQAGTEGGCDRLHDVRVATKKLRYAAEVLDGLARTYKPGERALLRRVQVVLGAQHDAHLLVLRVRGLERQRGGTMEQWRNCRRIEAFLDTRCRRLGRRFFEDREALIGLCHRYGAMTPTGSTEDGCP